MHKVQTSRESGCLRTALVCMPFYLSIRPSIQLGLLSAIARDAGFAVDCHHLNLDLAALIDSPLYNAICLRHVLGEWLFSVAAFGDSACQDDLAYYGAFPQEAGRADESGIDPDQLSHLRHVVLPDYIEQCLSAANWGDYQVVGFTSTFQQNVASLALARRIKERHPKTALLLGGANMDGEMGKAYAESFAFIDYVAVGEADATFPALLRSLADGREPGHIPGLAWRNGEGLHFNEQPSPPCNLDTLPTPDYEDYFQRAKALGLMRQQSYVGAIPFESSRGCWWGQKHQCRFCGVNGHDIEYRAKDPARVLSELSELARRHRVTFFEATDSILSMDYVSSLFTTIEEAKADYQFYYEVKANLSMEQIGTLYRGGVRTIQPGIESLSSHLLGLMRKGCSMLQNVRFLKWSRYYRMRVCWNLLWGFPGETTEDYEQELAVMKQISHLDPPAACGRFWLERFSPYFCSHESSGIHNVRPQASYRYIYPSYVDPGRIAYFFDYSAGETLADEAHAGTVAWVKEWQRRCSSEEPDTLHYRRTLDGVYIDDNRGEERRGSYAYYGPLALMYEFCSSTMHSAQQVAEHLAQAEESRCYSLTEVRDALDEFCRLGLMLREDGFYLSLALPANQNW